MKMRSYPDGVCVCVCVCACSNSSSSSSSSNGDGVSSVRVAKQAWNFPWEVGAECWVEREEIRFEFKDNHFYFR